MKLIDAWVDFTTGAFNGLLLCFEKCLMMQFSRLADMSCAAGTYPSCHYGCILLCSSHEGENSFSVVLRSFLAIFFIYTSIKPREEP